MVDAVHARMCAVNVHVCVATLSNRDTITVGHVVNCFAHITCINIAMLVLLR